MSVLILATATDEHAVAVADELGRLGARVEIVDLSEYPQRTQVSLRYECCSDCGGRSYALEVESGRLELEQFGAVWWRRPQQPQVSPEIVRASHRTFAATEAYEAITGLWYSLDAFWVNDPARDQIAHRKAYQLGAAQDAGLRIPQTLITNDPREARAFADARGYRGIVYKAFSATQEEWRETRVLKQEEIDLLESVRYAPVIFQEYIEAVYDVRVTMVGGQVFAAAIHSQQTEYPVDFRMDIASARIEAVQLPDEVEELLRDLMRRLGLEYGAIDMRRTPDDRFVFLEINPAGQWLFIEQESGQQIAGALARRLFEQDRAAAE